MPHLVRPLPRPGRVLAAGLVCGLVLSLAAAHAAPPGGAAPPAAPAVPHDRAFWRAIKAADFAVPKGSSAVALVDELSAYFSSPDPDLRDDLAYSIPAAWIERGLFDAEAERRLVALWTGQLSAGLSEPGDDRVLLRSYSALGLSNLAERDLAAPFLGAEGHRALLDAALAYLAGERDLRGYDREKGWYHATAHTADLLKFLSRSPHLRREDAARVLAAIEARLDTAGEILGQAFAWGESERLADAATALVLGGKLDPKALDECLAHSVAAVSGLWSGPFDPARYAAVRNRQAFLTRLHLRLILNPTPTPATEAARARVLDTLAQM
ncbi:MAG TPA: DUF2785 domain-containing protein [Thermoanaerobaculia bacterium]|nr:DUF2785 domain-containing protein [Thermoanaerobaculia bacterium]